MFSGRTTIAIAALACLWLGVFPALGQSPVAPSPRQQRIDRWQQKRTARQERQKKRASQNHAGDWLRRYKDVPPDQQREALENDPEFKKLPPARQTALRQRLQHFSSLPAEKQDRILSRMETWEHLTSEQKQQAKGLFQQIQQLPPQRRRKLNSAVRDMRDLTPEQREQLIDSDRYKNMFSDHERELLSGVARLPLASGEAGPPETPEP